MNARTVDIIAASGLQLLRRRLRRLPLRSPLTGHTILLMVHLAGFLLVISPLIMLFGGAGGAMYLFERIQGPLDWFLIELQIAVSLLGCFLSLQLLAVRPAQPVGVVVTPGQSPELFDMLARRATHFRMRPLSGVFLTSGTQLHVVAAPVLPLPLMHKYYLCIGAPLLFFLGRDQFRLALAGAMAGSASDRSHLTGWLYRASDDWPLIVTALASRNNLLAHMLTTPLRGVIAITENLVQALRPDWRVQQGHWLMQHSDADSAMDYLANQVVATEFLDQQYWPMMLKAAERCSTPVVSAFSHLPLLLGKTLDPQLVHRWLAQAQTARGQHRSGIADLLAELKLDHLRWSGLQAPNAFQAFFKTTEPLKQLDQLWQQAIEPEWQLRYARYQNDRARFERLQRRVAAGALRGASALRYVKLAPRFLEAADAVVAFRDAYNTNPDDAKVCFSAGLALLRAGAGQDGHDALRRAAELEPSLAKRAHRLIDEHRQAWIHDEERTDKTISRASAPDPYRPAPETSA